MSPAIVRGLIALALILGLAAPAEAALVVTKHGPRAGTVAGMIKASLYRAGVRNARVDVRVRRGRPAWVISVRVYKVRGRAPVHTQHLRARRGRLTWAAANHLARRAAAALRGGGGGRRRPEPPVEVTDPGADKAATDDAGDAGGAEAKEPEQEAPAQEPARDNEETEVADAAPTGPPPAPPAPAPQPEAVDKDLGFEVNEGQKREKEGDFEVVQVEKRAKREGKPKRRDAEEDPDRVVVRVNAGLGLAWRRFLLDATTSAVNYETGIFSQFFFRGELYPLHLITDSGIADLGLRLAYTHSAGLKAEIDRGSGVLSNPNASLSRLWGGLNFRLPRFSNPRLPVIELRLGLNHMAFSVEELPALDASFTAMAAGGSVVVPIRRWIKVALDAEYRMLVRSRAEALKAYLVKTASLQGFSLEGGFCGKIIAGLGYRGTVTAERFLGDLTSLGGDNPMLVRDWYISVDAALTYEM